MMKRMLAMLLALVGMCAAVPGAHAQGGPGDYLVFDGNLLYDNSQDGVTPLPWAATSGSCGKTAAWLPPPPFTFTTAQLGTVYMTHNRTDRDPLLVDPHNLTSPRFDPQQLSPALAKYAGDGYVMGVTGYDSWLTQTDHAGAVPYRFPDPTRDWTTGWTYYNRAGGLGRTDLPVGRGLVILSGPQAASLHLTTANDYLLRGKVNMLAGTTLTIDAGVYLYGERATTGYLVIERGAKIFVNGTSAAPVVLTSDQVPGAMSPGDNGGLVIHGRAVANCLASPADSCVSEGGAGFFGGNDDEDDSGSIRYMRIEYSGKELSPDNELNSLTMNAVGRGTTIEYVQCHLGSDDAFEWFGGTARCRYLVATGQDDDGLDWQLGYRGRVQFAVVQQQPGRGDKGTEADNSEFNFAASPGSNPVLSNITWIGTNSPTAGAGSTNLGVHLRRGTAVTIVNSIILGFRGAGLNVSDGATFANCPGPVPAVHSDPVITGIEPGTINTGGIFMAASPNPVMGSMRIHFGLPSDQRGVRAQIFDAQGRLVETLASGPMSRGTHTVVWNTSRRAAGQYFFRVATEGGLSSSGKLVVVH